MAKISPTSGLKPPGMKEALGPNPAINGVDVIM